MATLIVPNGHEARGARFGEPGRPRRGEEPVGGRDAGGIQDHASAAPVPMKPDRVTIRATQKEINFVVVVVS